MRFSALVALIPTIAQPNCSVDAMLVFDGSTSMAETSAFTGSLPKIAEARQALARALPRVEDFRRIGLMIYGPQRIGDACDGIKLHFPPIDRASEPILEATGSIAPGGLTPLTGSVEQAAEIMNYRSEPAVIVLLTDGNETCGGRPCAVSQTLAGDAYNLTIHVIGYRLRAHDEFFRWNNPEQEFGGENVARCFADATGGLFVTTETVDELTVALQETLGCALIGGGGQGLESPTYPRPTFGLTGLQRSPI
ncbi:MAG: vWA domain-containing protein [Pseudomonadota bacterium]